MKDLACDTLVLIPVYNDWASVAILLPRLAAALANHGRAVSVLLVDDGSTQPPEAGLVNASPAGGSPLDIHVLQLRRNMGHQRALCIAMAWIHEHADFRALVVMDGDGEDNPDDVPALLEMFEKAEGKSLVFAERTRRAESLTFRLFYRLYKFLHVILTGKSVKIGNFSVIPPLALDHLVVVPDLWNHYAASATKTKLPMLTRPSPRMPRSAGVSRMNFAALAVHGLAALSTYGEIIGVRLLMTSLGLMVLTAGALGLLLSMRFWSHTVPPAWTAYLAGFLTVALMQIVVLSAIFILIILAGRQATPFIPIRDYQYFIRAFHRLRDAAR